LEFLIQQQSDIPGNIYIDIDNNIIIIIVNGFHSN
jgi:hypothetical protein